MVARIAQCERPASRAPEAQAHLRPGGPQTQLLPAVWIALIAAVTLTAGAVPVPDTELLQLTPAVPDGPATCSGIEALLVSPEIPVVSIVATRVAVLEPTVNVQVTLTCWPVLVLVTVAVGLASARYDAPLGSETLVTLVVDVAVVGTDVVLLVVPNSNGSAALHVTLPRESTVPIALPAGHVPPTRTWTWPLLIRRIPTVPWAILSYETALARILLFVTAPLASWAVPTLPLAICVAA